MLEEMKLKDVMSLVDLLKNKNVVNQSECFWQLEKAYFIRTVTMHLIGKLKGITEKELLLSNAVWVADSGRFYNALKDGTLNEVEPFVEEVILNRECIVDATIWTHSIPNKQK